MELKKKLQELSERRRQRPVTPNRKRPTASGRLGPYSYETRSNVVWCMTMKNVIPKATIFQKGPERPQRTKQYLFETIFVRVHFTLCSILKIFVYDSTPKLTTINKKRHFWGSLSVTFGQR